MAGSEGRRIRRGIPAVPFDVSAAVEAEMRFARGPGASKRSLMLGRPPLEVEEIDERGVVAFDQASISASGATIEHRERECRRMLVRC